MPTYTALGPPSVCLSSANAKSPTLTVDFTSVTDKIKETEERIDRHVDQLEEDIEYFNRKLEQQEEKIQRHEDCINDNYNINIEQDKKIKALEDTVQFLKDYTNYLEGRIMSLEDKLNDKKVC